MDGKFNEVLLHQITLAGLIGHGPVKYTLFENLPAYSDETAFQSCLAHIALLLQRLGEALQFALAHLRGVERKAESSLPSVAHEVLLEQNQVRKELSRHSDQLRKQTKTPTRSDNLFARHRTYSLH